MTTGVKCKKNRIKVLVGVLAIITQANAGGNISAVTVDSVSMQQNNKI